MHINYLILVHGNYNHLSRLIEALDGNDVSFFIHIDKKTTRLFEMDKENVTIIKKRNPIYWGGFGMIQATIDLIREARSQNNGGYYVLLSGADYPIRNNETIKKTLSAQKQFINILPGPLDHKPIERYEYYYFDIDRRNPSGLRYYFFRTIEKLQLNLKIKRKIPFKIFVGSQWFALTENCIDYILRTIDADLKYINYFRHAFIPDEAFFQTIIGNSKFITEVEGNITYVDWDVDPGPAMIQEKHIELFMQTSIHKTKYGENNPLFARKFDDNSLEIIQKIRKTLH